jgi:hypothetical protein
MNGLDTIKRLNEIAIQNHYRMVNIQHIATRLASIAARLEDKVSPTATQPWDGLDLSDEVEELYSLASDLTRE